MTIVVVSRAAPIAKAKLSAKAKLGAKYVKNVVELTIKMSLQYNNDT
jgi:hypothetical protein